MNTGLSNMEVIGHLYRNSSGRVAGGEILIEMSPRGKRGRGTGGREQTKLEGFCCEEQRNEMIARSGMWGQERKLFKGALFSTLLVEIKYF